MIRFFSINDPYRLLAVFAFMVVMGFVAHHFLPSATYIETKGMVVGEMMSEGLSLYDEVWDSTPPLTASIHWISVELFERNLGFRRGIMVLILFAQAAMLGFLLSKNRAFDQPGFLSSFIYAILTFFSFDSIAYTHEVWASFFLLLAIDRVLRQIQFRDQDYSNLSLLGILVGLSTIFVFTYSIFFIAILIIFILNSRPDLRQLLLFTFSFILPHLILFTFYSLKGSGSSLWTNFYLPNFEFNTRRFMETSDLFFLFSIPLAYLLFSLLMALRNARMTKYQSQIFQIMILWLLFGVLEVWLARQRTAQSLLVCAAPMAYLISFYLIRIRRPRIANMMLWLLLIGTISVATLGMTKKIKAIDYGLNFPNQPDNQIINKKVLVLSDDTYFYNKNQAAGFFPEWSVCSKVFKEPGYYEHVNVLYQAFKKNPPDVIVDPENLMPGIFYYLPELKLQYQQSDNYYARVKK